MKLLLAEDQCMLRDALVQLLELQEVVDIVYAAKDGQQAIDILSQYEVDIAILDVEMPYRTGLDVLQWVRQYRPEVKVVIVTTFQRPGYFERALQSDVDAYVLKERRISDLMQTLHRVMAGHKEYAPELMVTMVANPLNTRERQIIRHIEQGLSNKDIAQKMCLSNGTVRNYISIIFNKLHAENRTEAVNIAKHQGWI